MLKLRNCRDYCNLKYAELQLSYGNNASVPNVLIPLYRLAFFVSLLKLELNNLVYGYVNKRLKRFCKTRD